MYRDAIRKTYVNMFVRKIKQTFVGRNKPHHPLLEEVVDSDLSNLKTFKWNFKVEAVYTLIMVMLMLLAYLATTTGLAFPEIVDLPFMKAISGLTALGMVMEIVSNFVSRSSLDISEVGKETLMREAGRKYLRGWLLVDCLILTVFVADLLTSDPVISFCKFSIILKLGGTFSKIRNLQIIFIENCFKEQYLELIKVFLSNFFFAHFLAIILILMAQHSSHSWLHHNHLYDKPWSEQYIWSYYWATTIMLTVGFGDLTPINTTEVIVVIFIETFSCIFLAYNINNVGTIIRKITALEEEKLNNLKIFTQMKYKENVSEDIKDKITNYIVKSTELKRKYNI